MMIGRWNGDMELSCTLVAVPNCSSPRVQLIVGAFIPTTTAHKAQTLHRKQLLDTEKSFSIEARSCYYLQSIKD